ncbi:MAG: glycosyltransferase family 2 protein [Candidatus Onthoplasma sp.]
MEDKISVIVPIYKVEKYLRKCIDSIINQTYKNLEIILVDDGSPDNCPVICDEYAKLDNRIKVIHKRNGGLMQAWIDGVNQSSGDYIYFIDSDDWIELNSITIYMDIIKKYHPDIILNDYFITTDKNKRVGKAYDYNFTGYADKQETSKFKQQFINAKTKIMYYRWNKIFKRNIILNNLKHLDTRITKLEDFNIVLPTIIDAQTLYFMHNPTYNYYVRQNSMIREKFQEKDLENFTYVLKQMYKILIDKKVEYKSFVSDFNMWLIIDQVKNIFDSNTNKYKSLDKLKNSYIVENPFKEFVLLNAKKRRKFFYKALIKRRYFTLKLCCLAIKIKQNLIKMGDNK